jgi:hypothetical protein
LDEVQDCDPKRDILIVEGSLQEYICVLLKNGLFSPFYCSFWVFLGVERAHSCAPVRKMSKKRRKTKKNDAEFAMLRGFPTVSDKGFDRVKQKS